MTHLQVDAEKHGEVILLRLKGFLDAHNHGLFRDALEKYASQGHTRFVVDFSELTYIGSSGIEVLLSRIQPLRDQGGDILLSGMSPKIYKVFDLLGLPALFVICKDAAEALAKAHG